MKTKSIILFLSSIVAILCAANAAENPPYRMIYDNDTTNILNCVSPFNPPNDPVFTEEKLRASVREAVVPGMDAQLLQPGTSWVPWWPSKLVPLAKQEAWFRQHYGEEPNIPEHRYLLSGGDIVGPFIDECHKNHVAALVSFRVNDGHHQERSFDEKPPAELAHCINQFYTEHPQYRLAPPPSRAIKDRVHNWLIPEARAYKEAILQELIDSYPKLDGIELDFLRHPYYFPENTPMSERVQVMTGFIKKARGYLDAVAQKTDGKHRYLGVRVPLSKAQWQDVGFDPAAWRAAGVDYFNLSPSYCITQQGDVAAVRQDVPDARIYLELTHTAQTWKFGGPGYDDHCFRRSTPEILQNTARQGYARGADGMSFFNFVYYRQHGGLTERRGPFNEPPFDALPELADKAALDKKPGYFFLAVKDELFASPTKRATYNMDIVPAKGNGPATVRILVLTDEEKFYSERESAKDIDRGQWEVTLNGVVLTQKKNTDDSYPFPSQFKAGFAKPQQYAAFEVPSGLLKDGQNTVKIGNLGKKPLRLRWIEISQPILGE